MRNAVCQKTDIFLDIEDVEIEITGEKAFTSHRKEKVNVAREGKEWNTGLAPRQDKRVVDPMLLVYGLSLMEPKSQECANNEGWGSERITRTFTFFLHLYYFVCKTKVYLFSLIHL